MGIPPSPTVDDAQATRPCVVPRGRSIIKYSAAEALHKACEKCHPLPLALLEHGEHDLELTNAAEFLKAVSKFLNHVRAHPPVG